MLQAVAPMATVQQRQVSNLVLGQQPKVPIYYVPSPSFCLNCFSPYKKEEGVSISTEKLPTSYYSPTSSFSCFTRGICSRPRAVQVAPVPAALVFRR